VQASVASRARQQSVFLVSAAQPAGVGDRPTNATKNQRRRRSPPPSLSKLKTNNGRVPLQRNGVKVRAPQQTRQQYFKIETRSGKKPASRSSVTTMKLDNFYDFRSSRDVTRYKMRLQDALFSTGSTRLPKIMLTRRRQVGRMS